MAAIAHKPAVIIKLTAEHFGIYLNRVVKEAHSHNVALGKFKAALHKHACQVYIDDRCNVRLFGVDYLVLATFDVQYFCHCIGGVDLV